MGHALLRTAKEGYGVLTLRKDKLEKVSRYIDRQEDHHRRGTLSELLERYESEEDDWPEGVMKPPEGGSIEFWFVCIPA